MTVSRFSSSTLSAVRRLAAGSSAFKPLIIGTKHTTACSFTPRGPVRLSSTIPQIDAVHPTSQSAYNTNHASYDLYRSAYPEAAVELCASLAGSTQHTLEVAAGTGKFTAQILQILPTDRYVATDPNPGMATTFRKNLPQVKFVEASSTSLPFADSSFDVIYAAQSFHWFATKDSLEEFSRVLRPGGRLVMLWNYEDEKSMPMWQRMTTSAVWEHDGNVPQYRKGDWLEVLKENNTLFDTFCERHFPYKVTVGSQQALWDYWKTRSYVTALNEVEKNALKHRIFASTQGEKSLVAARGCHVVWLTKPSA